MAENLCRAQWSWAGRVSLRRGAGCWGKGVAGTRGIPEMLAALCSNPAAPGLVGNRDRGEQVFVIMDQLMPEPREGGRPSPWTRSGIGLSSRVQFCPGTFLNKQDVSTAKTSSSDVRRRKGGPAVRASDLGGRDRRDSPALCHRHLPWPRARPFTFLCKVGSAYLLVTGCLIPRGAGM